MNVIFISIFFLCVRVQHDFIYSRRCIFQIRITKALLAAIFNTNSTQLKAGCLCEVPAITVKVVKARVEPWLRVNVSFFCNNSNKFCLDRSSLAKQLLILHFCNLTSHFVP